jgi:hypothetical protein
MSQSRTEVVMMGGSEDLRLALQPPKGHAANDPVAVNLERRP